jgi:hypothetical protein
MYRSAAISLPRIALALQRCPACPLARECRRCGSNHRLAYGKPLVDVYDFHWYPEIYDANGTRILDLTGTTLTDAQVQLIVQGPRDLWDPTFNDDNNSNP